MQFSALYKQFRRTLMSRKYFNFNNEQDLIPVDVDEDGKVTINVDGTDAEFDSAEDFAENYAVARNVLPENLKNWTLIEDGDQISFVLEAGTAGAMSQDEITQIIKNALDNGMDISQVGKLFEGINDQTETKVANKAGNTESVLTFDDVQSNVFSNFNRTDKFVLGWIFNVDSRLVGEDFDRSLYEKLLNANYLTFDHYDEDDIDDAKDQVYDDGYDEDDEFDTVVLSTLVYNALNDLVDRRIQELAANAPKNAPIELAIMVMHHYGESHDEALDALKKRLFSATLAGRQFVPVATFRVSDDGNFSTHYENGSEEDEDLVSVPDDFGTWHFAKHAGRDIDCDLDQVDPDRLYMSDGRLYYQI